MNLLAMTKMLKKGGLGTDELEELLSAMGIRGKFSPVPVDQALPEFQKMANATSLPGASLVCLEMEMKSGQKLAGLLVMVQAEDESNSQLKLSA